MTMTVVLALADPLPGPASPLDVLGVLLLAGLVGVVWVAAIVRWPWVVCTRRRCRGGKIQKAGKGPASWRDCPTCGGRGRRVKTAARFWRWALRMDRV